MILAAHQPNFIPWMPFFQKIAAVDIFVLLGHCQYEKNGFQNRFRLREGSPWHTMSVKHGNTPIREKRYANHEADWTKIKFRLLEHPALSKFDKCVTESLWETNVSIILRLVEELGIKTRIEFDFPTPRKGSERLVQLCQHYGANAYLAGSGGSKYMEPEVFRAAGIKIEQQEYHDRRHVLEVLK